MAWRILSPKIVKLGVFPVYAFCLLVIKQAPIWIGFCETNEKILGTWENVTPRSNS